MGKDLLFYYFNKKFDRITSLKMYLYTGGPDSISLQMRN